MPSDKAIEAAARELAEADARDFDTQPQSFRDGDIQLAKFVLSAAYAIDGDYNAGVEVASDQAALYGADEEVVAAILRLKR